MAATDPLAGLAEVDWPGLHAASGPAAGVPGLLRAVVGDDAAARSAAVGALWETVWHQGTVYDVTPEVVPFLVAVVADHRVSDGIRAELALLLANVAAASSFVVDDRWYVVDFVRGGEDPVPAVELDARCRARLAGLSPALDPVLAAGPPLVRAAVVAVAATVAGALSADAQASLTAFADGDDVLVATAAGVVLDLARGGSLTAADLLARAGVDADSAEFLAHIPTWPPAVQAVELVRELSEKAVAARIEAGRSGPAG